MNTEDTTREKVKEINKYRDLRNNSKMFTTDYYFYDSKVKSLQDKLSLMLKERR